MLKICEVWFMDVCEKIYKKNFTVFKTYLLFRTTKNKNDLYIKFCKFYFNLKSAAVIKYFLKILHSFEMYMY